ncbi:Hypothetical Protein FCC1311_026422 [Hondaea fermentalgiana]|uniref:Uncharacterized protein n=1 Tax=Hondaea fermentalgiana TaxID=2315210 RepID=A0A2R5GDY0_9STRA|nr:Hypothetical Protein FCC1311_026422 [Hondaea fermentalgiana]|eukprot:GBG26421.1 Hypothetical Protein FCC1311_026422 [Hondaea fermentalgiana]
MVVHPSTKFLFGNFGTTSLALAISSARTASAFASTGVSDESGVVTSGGWPPACPGSCPDLVVVVVVVASALEADAGCAVSLLLFFPHPTHAANKSIRELGPVSSLSRFTPARPPGTPPAVVLFERFSNFADGGSAKQYDEMESFADIVPLQQLGEMIMIFDRH